MNKPNHYKYNIAKALQKQAEVQRKLLCQADSGNNPQTIPMTVNASVTCGSENEVFHLGSATSCREAWTDYRFYVYSHVFFSHIFSKKTVNWTHVTGWPACRRVEDSFEALLSGVSELVNSEKLIKRKKAFKFCFMFLGWTISIKHYRYFNFYFSA